MKQPYKENCKWYDYWQDMGARIPICKAGKNMDESGYYLITCDGCEEYSSKYVTTNADRIRRMTDEKLAKFIQEDVFAEPWCSDDVPYVLGSGCQLIDKDCGKCALKWLKQEAE